MKMQLLFVLVVLPFILSTVQGQEEQDYYLRDHSLAKPYQASGWKIPHWDFYGSTIISSDHIRLTPDARSLMGGIWNTVPLMKPSWEVQMQFKIHGSRKDLFGDGMVFWYARDRMIPGPVFGSTDFFHGLAVIIDTYSNHNGPHNHQHPYISAMLNNGTLHYDHDRDGTLTQLAGCEAKVRNFDHNTYLSIRYTNEILTVSTDLLGDNKWKECFSIHGIVLPVGYWLGVTAATGDLSDTHDLLAIRTYEIGSEVLSEAETIRRSHLVPSSKFSEPPREHHEDPTPTTSYLKIFFYFIIGAVVISALVILGIILYQNHQANSRKRFY